MIAKLAKSLSLPCVVVALTLSSAAIASDANHQDEFQAAMELPVDSWCTDFHAQGLAPRGAYLYQKDSAGNWVRSNVYMRDNYEFEVKTRFTAANGAKLAAVRVSSPYGCEFDVFLESDLIFYQ